MCDTLLLRKKGSLKCLVHGIHGINHNKRVLFLVELLAALENLTETERDILSIAACYHEIGRTHDGKDSCRCYEEV
jgi:hypothetical protein